MKVTIETDLPLYDELKRVAEILVKLRYRTEYWKENYGAKNKDNKVYWENKADEWIKEHVKGEVLNTLQIEKSE